MRLRGLFTTLAITVLCVGCGINENNKLDEVNTESSIAVSIEASEEATDEASEEATDEASEETTEDTSNISTQDRYKAFASDSEKVYFDESGSEILPYDLGELFDLSKGYTISELIETSLVSYSMYDKEKGEPSFETKLIDCGKDGIDELQVDIRYPGMEDDHYEEDDDQYIDHWIIKDIDDKLVVKFFGASRLSSYTIINQYGYVENKTIGAYNGVLPESYGFIDKDGNWVLYYKYYYYLDVNDYAREKSPSGAELDFTSDEWKNMQIEEYLFDKNAKITESEKEGFITYFKYNDTGIIEDDSIYEASSVYKELFNEAGINTCKRGEVEKKLEERRAEIGLSDDILNN